MYNVMYKAFCFGKIIFRNFRARRCLIRGDYSEKSREEITEMLRSFR